MKAPPAASRGALSAPDRPRANLLVLLAAFAMPFLELGAPLLEVDDARYAQVPFEIVATGRWAAPTLNGLPYVEKPPLWYWLAAASYMLFGVSEAAARLPLALLSALGLAGVFWLTRWLYDAATASSATMILSSAALYAVHSHYITPDLPLAVFLLWSCALILRALVRPEDARWAAPAAWLFAALAVLSKGLIGVLFPSCWALALALLRPAWRAPAKALLRPLGPALFFAAAAPWFLVVEQQRPGFLKFFFIEHHFERYTTTKFNRYSPWWYFLLVLPGTMMPWTPLALAGAARALRAPRVDPAAAALALWVLLVAGFFSASSSKLASYMVPVAPQLAILAALALRAPPRWCVTFYGGLAVLFLAALGAVPLVAKIPPEFRVPLAGAAGFLAAGPWLYWRCGGSPQGARAIVVSTLAAGLIVVGALKAHPDILSAKRVAAAIVGRSPSRPLVYTYSAYMHGLAFYLGQPVDMMINWVGEFEYAKREEAYERRFGDDANLRSLPLRERRVHIVTRGRELAHLRSQIRLGAVREERAFGPWALLEIAGREELDTRYGAY